VIYSNSVRKANKALHWTAIPLRSIAARELVVMRIKRILRMNKQQFQQILVDCLKQITEDRLFGTERGYQGALAGLLCENLKKQAIWPGNPIVEEEYQKRAHDHGITFRPDIIIHIPFDRGIYPDRKHGNFVVMMLKLNASKDTALEDYEKLTLICEKLDYSIAVFLNIGSQETFLSEYDGTFKERMFGYGVVKKNGNIVITENA